MNTYVRWPGFTHADQYPRKRLDCGYIGALERGPTNSERGLYGSSDSQGPLQCLSPLLLPNLWWQVLHGSTSDIVWLQRDLGLYIVGLFDTYHASNILGYPKHGLAYLLQRFAKFDTDKRYQMADWRMRSV